MYTFSSRFPFPMENSGLSTFCELKSCLHVFSFRYLKKHPRNCMRKRITIIEKISCCLLKLVVTCVVAASVLSSVAGAGKCRTPQGLQKQKGQCQIGFCPKKDISQAGDCTLCQLTTSLQICTFQFASKL